MSPPLTSKDLSIAIGKGRDSSKKLSPASLASTKNTKRSQNSKSISPCDGCSVRKVKCSGSRPCTRCVKKGIPCTNNRIKKKSGPKSKKNEDQTYFRTVHLDLFSETGTHTNKPPPGVDFFPSNVPQPQSEPIPAPIYSTYFEPSKPITKELIPMSILLPYLQVYQTWYYSLWPVLSVTHLVTKLTILEPGEVLDQEGSVSYALCLAVCAAISRKIAFISEDPNIIHLPTGVRGRDYVLAALRIRNEYEHLLHPTSETLLTSFFLYVYYFHNEGGINAAITYLREAISMAQIMNLQDPDTYLNKSPTEVHRLRKIYYILLVTERYMCIEKGMPVILDSTIQFPMSQDEEYSNLLTGFTELIKIFSIPDRSFFEKMRMLHNTGSNYDNLRNFFHFPINNITEGWVIDVDNKIKGISIKNSAADIQKANFLLSKHWMRSLVWHVAFQNGLVTYNREDADCLSVKYPVTIAYEFLASTSNLPMYAFESNGPQVVVKLLEIANGMADTMNDLAFLKDGYDTFACLNALNSIFWFISRFKIDVSLPMQLYHKIESIVNASPIPKMRFSPVSSPERDLEGHVSKTLEPEGNSSNSPEDSLSIVVWS